MKTFLASVLGLLLINSMAFASDLRCFNNHADQNVKKICLLESNKGKLTGFLLFNANGTKSYLVVIKVKESGYGEQGGGHLEWAYTVKKADSELLATDSQTSVITIVQDWDYSEGVTYIRGKTPGGRTLAAVIESSDFSAVMKPDNLF